MARKESRERFVAAGNARRSPFHPGQAVQRGRGAPPVSLSMPPFPVTIVIDAGEAGGIGNALVHARNLFPGRESRCAEKPQKTA